MDICIHIQNHIHERDAKVLLHLNVLSVLMITLSQTHKYTRSLHDGLNYYDVLIKCMWEKKNWNQKKNLFLSTKSLVRGDHVS